ncbi:MAG: hypothetical protein HUK26_08685, partial [Duodenibacillus sp.]|nr:hypothetical protein [Duodenibacillus sp.]
MADFKRRILVSITGMT